MQQNQASKHTAYLLIVLQCTIYGLGDALAKNAYRYVDVYSFLTVRYAIGLGFMLLLFGKRICRNVRSCRVKDWIMPCLGVSGAYLFNNIALTYTKATAVAFLRSTSVIMTPLILFVCYKKTIKMQQVFVIAAAVIGLYLLCGRDGLSGIGPGEIMALMAALLSAVALVSSRAALAHIDSISLTTLETAASMVLSLVFAFTAGSGVSLPAANAAVWWSMVYLAIISTLGGYMLQNLALKSISPRTVSTLKCLSPVMTAVFSYLILKEVLGLWGIVGACVITASAVMQALIKDNDA